MPSVERLNIFKGAEGQPTDAYLQRLQSKVILNYFLEADCARLHREGRLTQQVCSLFQKLATSKKKISLQPAYDSTTFDIFDKHLYEITTDNMFLVF